MKRWTVLLTACFLAVPNQSSGQPKPAAGPLRAVPGNGRWFADPSGRAVVLAGSHTWQSLQDNGLLMRNGAGNPPPVFDFDAYLGFLERHNHNLFRLWRWETTKWTDSYTGNVVKHCRPHPWARTGPGLAEDGEPRFDLERFNPEYFDRLRSRVRAARDRGIYVSVMLFEGWEHQFTDGWQHHPFHAPNNVNGIEADANGDGKGVEFNTLLDTPMGRRVSELQRAYVRKVIDTVGDLENVLYEACNEASGESTAWQYHLIRFVKDYERSKPQQHPIGMTFQYRGGSNATLFESPADWISPNPGDNTQSYIENPCATCTTKVVVNDTDHLWGHTGGDNIWVWKSFTRGLNVLFMEELLASPTWQDSARSAMGQIRRYGDRMNLAAMVPDEKVSATRFCLAARGKEYLVFQWNKGEFAVDLKDSPGNFEVEWLNVNADKAQSGGQVQGGATRTFTTPFPGPAVLYLRHTD